jgi:cytochrome c6
MKRIVVLLALAAFAFTVHAADDAAALFKSKCAMCHGATGGGDTPMGKKLALKPLASEEVQKKSDADLTKLIAEGKGKMPAFAAKLTAAQIKDVVTLIRGFAKP